MPNIAAPLWKTNRIIKRFLQSNYKLQFVKRNSLFVGKHSHEKCAILFLGGTQKWIK